MIGDHCDVLDPATGETRQTITLPSQVNPDGKATWTYIGVFDDLLIAGVDFANQQDASAIFKLFAKLSKRGTAWSPQWFASRRVAVLDRASGKLLWHADAEHSFLHNGVIAGNDKLFLLDKLPKSVEDQRSRRGLELGNYRISAHDIRTGKALWERRENVFGTWLGYSAEHDTLIHAGAAAPDRAMDEAKAGLLAMRGESGNEIWMNEGLEYSGPCIIHNDRIIMNSRSYAPTSGVVSIESGKPVLLENPVTGNDAPWTYQRTYGCNTAVASEHLLTFRSGAAGYYDLNQSCGVANLGGFRSGCSSNLIAADGVLNAPDFTRTCSCGYQNQTSLALVHMPEVEVWTVNPFKSEAETTAVSRLGINFGAAGTRRAGDGTVWMEYPPTSSDEFPVPVEIDGEKPSYSRRHASSQTGDLPWVHASALEGFSSIVLKVNSKEEVSRNYTVRCHFPKPVSDDLILVQGNSPDVAAEGSASADDRVRVFSSVTAARRRNPHRTSASGRLDSRKAGRHRSAAGRVNLCFWRFAGALRYGHDAERPELRSGRPTTAHTFGYRFGGLDRCHGTHERRVLYRYVLCCDGKRSFDGGARRRDGKGEADRFVRDRDAYAVYLGATRWRRTSGLHPIAREITFSKADACHAPACESGTKDALRHV